jgi:hypothetical protein
LNVVRTFNFFYTLYIIKIKGKVKIPDYAQLRDDNFTLIAYFRTDRPERALDKCGLTSQTKYIMAIIKDMPFGKMQKIEL